MQADLGFSDLIYHYLVTRFHFQYYAYGESLPTIDVLCRQFNVSSLTIKSAFKRLQKEGYISRNHGRRAIVTFQGREKQLDDYAVQFFAKRRDMIPDLYRSTELVVLPMIGKGFGKMGDADFAYLEQLTRGEDPEDQIRYYYFILQKTQNALILNLFWESILFLGLPFPPKDRGHVLYDAQVSRRRLKELTACGRAGDTEKMKKAHLAFQQDVSEEIHRYIARRILFAEKGKQVPFVWRLYRNRPQIYGSLAVRIIHDVYQGDFQHKEFLPSYEKMAERYHVSVSTMRRTVSLLNELGATQSINGKGTRILLVQHDAMKKDPDLTLPAIRSNTAYYLQSFELIAESCEGVIGWVFQETARREKAELLRLLEGYLDAGQYTLFLLSIFAYITEHSPLQALREIYEKLYRLILWGYTMKEWRREIPGLEEKVKRFSRTVITALKADDIAGFAHVISVFMKEEFAMTKKILAEHGYTQEDHALLPSFGFIRTDQT